MAPVYLASKFTTIVENSRYLTIHAQFADLKPPQPNLEILGRSFEYQGIAVWKNLDVNVRNDASIQCFKAMYFRSMVGYVSSKF